MIKTLFKTRKKRLAAGFLGTSIYWITRILRMTMRMRIIGGEIPQAFQARGEGLIWAFWHSRLILPVFAYRGKGCHCLISSHGDGEIISSVMTKYGQHLVRGSSSKKGTEALKKLIKLAREQKDIAITPDGPRGPAELVKPGVAILACLTKSAVMPVGCSAKPAKRLSSWDRFMLPYPFSRGVVVFEEPLRCREIGRAHV